MLWVASQDLCCRWPDSEPNTSQHSHPRVIGMVAMHRAPAARAVIVSKITTYFAYDLESLHAPAYALAAYDCHILSYVHKGLGPRLGDSWLGSKPVGTTTVVAVHGTRYSRRLCIQHVPLQTSSTCFVFAVESRRCCGLPHVVAPQFELGSSRM